MTNDCPLRCYDERTKHYFCTFDRSADCTYKNHRLCRTFEFWELEHGLLEDEVNDDNVQPPTAEEIIKIVEENVIPSISLHL